MFGFSLKSITFCRCYSGLCFIRFSRSIKCNLNVSWFHFDVAVDRILIKGNNVLIRSTTQGVSGHTLGMATTLDTCELQVVSVDVEKKEEEEEKEEEEVIVINVAEEKKRKHEANSLSSRSQGEGHLKKKQRTRLGRPGNGVEKYDETDYYFENGLRKVRPYFYKYTTFCKGRWVNRKLLDVFSQEFRALPSKEFARAIDLGSITVNSMKVNIDYQLKERDFIENMTHRHEIPVTAEPIKIVHLSDDLLVIDKPSSIPVHPCGRYRHNSVVFILGKEFNFRDIKSVHRLDRLTSGLLIFARTTEKARELEIQIRSRLVEKEYLCRVEGEFPSEPVTCEEPIDVISFQIGICKVTPKGKNCRTIFERLSYNGKTSVVLCKPHTGRMHQIRVHLQFLGYPIINDPLYNHPAFGPQRGKNGDTGQSDEELIASLIKAHNMEIWLKDGAVPDTFNVPSCDSASATSIATSDSCEQNESVQLSDLPATNHELNEHSKAVLDPNCLECNGRITFKDPEPKDLVMFLHAWKYKGVNWNFETEKPQWADDNFSGDP